MEIYQTSRSDFPEQISKIQNWEYYIPNKNIKLWLHIMIFLLIN